ncbi:MAG: L,D-transpeptidase family protein [Chloroflexi bacterium]|nr:L,D-transpeptidase family protein [Chloroflexota bacterium]
MTKRILTALCLFVLLLGLSLPPAAPASAASWTGYVSTDAVNVRSAPNTSASIIDVLPFGTAITIVGAVSGENAGAGSTWYQTISGWYVYAAYISESPQQAPLDGNHGGRWIDIDVSNQTATAYEGNTAVFTAGVTTGRPGTPTPIGTFYIFSRVYNETMVSTTPGDEYYLENVYFTQYFAGGGYALHYNYWQPDYVFGSIPTSHGCVGLRYGAAAFFWDFADYGTPVVVHY